MDDDSNVKSTQNDSKSDRKLLLKCANGFFETFIVKNELVFILENFFLMFSLNTGKKLK